MKSIIRIKECRKIYKYFFLFYKQCYKEMVPPYYRRLGGMKNFAKRHAYKRMIKELDIKNKGA